MDQRKCGRCKHFKSHGKIGECVKANYLLVTTKDDVCRLEVVKRGN